MVQVANAHFGKIDILVNNAALWRCWSAFSETPIEEWKKFIDVNIMGTVYFTKAVLDQMVDGKYGSVSPSDDRNIDSYNQSELSFMGRTGTNRENANLICFLASEEAGYISGQNIQIDGCRKKQ